MQPTEQLPSQLASEAAFMAALQSMIEYQVEHELPAIAEIAENPLTAEIELRRQHDVQERISLFQAILQDSPTFYPVLVQLFLEWQSLYQSTQADNNSQLLQAIVGELKYKQHVYVLKYLFTGDQELGVFAEAVLNAYLIAAFKKNI